MKGEFIKPENVKTFGSNALLIEWPQKIEPDILYSILAVKKYLNQSKRSGLIESVIGYASLALFFEQTMPEKEMIQELLEKCPQTLLESIRQSSKTIELPVCYEKTFALDREFAESDTGLTFDEIIHLHSRKDYLLYFTGFMPGFMYLGGLDPRIQMPRKETPRVEVPSGSVGIAGFQTGIYPFTSPGGWQIIGRCPVRLFDPMHSPHCPAKSGDVIKFRPITTAEFLKI